MPYLLLVLVLWGSADDHCEAAVARQPVENYLTNGDDEYLPRSPATHLDLEHHAVDLSLSSPPKPIVPVSSPVDCPAPHIFRKAGNGLLFVFMSLQW